MPSRVQRCQLRAKTLPTFLLLAALAAPLRAQLCAPAPGIELPAAYLEYRREHPDSHRFERAWTPRVPETTAGIAGKGGSGGSVAGHFEVPLFMVRFADSGRSPYPPELLQSKLFDGPLDETMKGYYAEVSAGQVELSGSTHGWHQLPDAGSYYAGTSYGTVPGNARLGELLRHTFESYDSSIDFAQYDNDGPDGLPNSGDDDGYVDFVAIVQPYRGGECGGNSNIWSHRWRYSAWPASSGSPFITGDLSANGGPILIDDYTVQPALSCDGVNPVEIGIFCHEFGHAFGLPDLYDVDGGGGAGLGHWCLMASGNWNDPPSPAHMSAWAKQKLGWVDTVVVDWQGTPLMVEPIGQLPIVYELPLVEDRWGRRPDCAIKGVASLSVGLEADGADARGWGAIGYGNAWRETIAHDFHYDGNGSVVLSYDYAVDTDAAFDFLFVVLTQGGVEQTLAIRSGRNSGRATHEFSARLKPGDYRLAFRFVSDRSYSTEDGKYRSTCFPAVVDDLSLSGGGENHFADFEYDVAGWYAPVTAVDNPVGERWLIENRQAEGFDRNLIAGGLLVYHVDEEVIGSALGNSGGSDNQRTRGVALEEADGQGDLTRQGGGRGQATDIWPQDGVTVFDVDSRPSSRGNSGQASGARLEAIAAIGKDVTLQAWAGRPAPEFTGVFPGSVESTAGAVWIELLGARGVQHGARLRLQATGLPTVHPSEVDWIDQDRVRARIDFGQVQTASYDVVLENPDGQTALGAGAIQVNGSPTVLPEVPGVFALHQNAPNPFNPATSIRFELPRSDRILLSVLDVRGRVIRQLLDSEFEAGSHDVRWDGRDDAGRPVASGLYFYRLQSRFGNQKRKMMLLR